MKGSFVILVTVLLLVANGCNSTGPYLRCYPGPARETNEVAVLKVQREFANRTAHVKKIDEEEFLKQYSYVNAREFELLPGSHTIEFSYTDGRGYSASNAVLTLSCVAGHVYELHVDRLYESMGKTFKTLTFGGTFYWTAWIIDAQTKDVVAGEKREEPRHWWE